jgi:hypothetical protein
LSLVPVGVIGMLGAFGYRHDGWCFNQRYLLELMPIFCIAAALALADWKPRWRWVVGGFIAGVALGIVIVREGESIGAQLAMMKVPVLVAVIVGLSWLVRERWPKATLVFAASLGLSLGWAATVHIIDDIPASRLLRAANAWKLETFQHAVPDDGKPIALYAYWGMKDAYGPLLLERDIVIVDPWIDDGKDAVVMLDALLRRGRIVYIDRGMPQPLLAALTTGRKVQGSKVPWLIRVIP